MVFTPETVDMTRASQQDVIQQIRQEYMQHVEENQVQPSNESFRQFVEAHEGFKKLTQVDDMRKSIIDRLRHQAMPAQIKIFEQYGKDNPSLLQMHAQNSSGETLSGISVSELK